MVKCTGCRWIEIWCGCLLFMALALWGVSAQAARPEFDIAPVPGWVRPVSPDLKEPSPSDASTQGVRTLLVDQQLSIETGTKLRYRHLATQTTSTEGVESQANISIGFDPSYERLTLHFVRVLRAGRQINKLKPAAIRILQRESGLEALIYDGSKTVNLFLDDVRVGDVVEYAYSLRGDNPAFEGKVFGRMDLQWSVPVDHAYARLRWPSTREIHFKGFNAPANPQTLESGGYQERVWDLRRITGLNVENDAPRSYDPYASVQWSEFANWHAVATWALPLYRLPSAVPPGVEALTNRLAQGLNSPEAKLFAVLNHVQREVRYLGIEVGAGSHAPNPPELVLQRRFGDCKDKAMLTVALLTAMGIEARPALVHTTMLEAIGEWQPAPMAFNHVIVMARIGGKPVWIDPTRAPQVGGYAHLAQADFGLALVVDEGTTRLVPTAGAQARADQRKIHSVIDSRAGLDKAVIYTVSTVTEGVSAERIRAWLASQSREKVQQQYTNFYAPYFEGIEAVGLVEIDDDSVNNRLTTTEHYRIPAFWKRNDAQKRLEGAIEVPDIDMVLRAPKTQVRSAPLGLSYPMEIVQVTEVLLPKPWGVKPDNTKIDNAAFTFDRQEAWKDATLRLTDRFATKAERVASADMPGYVAELSKARAAINYVLYSYDAPAAVKSAGTFSPHWIPAVAGVLALLAWLALAVRAYRWNPPRPENEPSAVTNGPSGLGGWLGLLGVAMTWGGYLLSRSLLELSHATSVEIWQATTQPDSASYHPLWFALILLELVAGLGMVIMRLLLIVLFFQKRSSFPQMFVWVVTATYACSFLDFGLGVLIPAATDFTSGKELGKLLVSAIGSVLWMLYLRRSRRVKNTFVRTR